MDNSGIMPVMDMNSGFGGGNSFIWIFGLLILIGMFNGGFGGFGGANQYATSAEVQRGFDAQNSMANERDILSAISSGTAQGVAATNQTFHDSLMANQGLYNELTRDISSLSMAQANLLANQNECCCSTKMLIQQTNYEGAMRDAATNANFTAQIQSVKDMIAQNKIEALQAQINRLELNAATSNVLRFPNSWTYAAGDFPPIVGA